MLRKIKFANIGLAGLAVASTLAMACVADRPSRNGVFDENQYLRKDFLITSGSGGVDEGWFVKSTVVQTSTPNPLGNAAGAGLFVGAQGGSTNFVRFQVSQDQMSIVDMRELSNDPSWNAQGQRESAAVNAWPITNVDLKYRVNLDGEKTNYYEENQELDWQLRQWVKINFAKNNLSDLFQFGDESNGTLQNCIDLGNTAVELHNNSFNVDEANGYFEYSLDFTIPIHMPPPDPNAAAGTVSQADVCAQAFGPAWQTFQALGRDNVTITVKYGFVRPSKVTDGTYVPMMIAEKDPIQHKYGSIQTTIPYRDPNTGLLGADTFVARHDPNKDMVYYFSPGMPKAYTDFMSKVLEPQTNNAVLAKAGAKGRLKFLNYNDATTLGDGQGPNREVGDPRYNFVFWHSDYDAQSGGLGGVVYPWVDPRTGEMISETMNVYEYVFQDAVQQRLEAFLQTVGAEYLTPSGDFDNSKYPPNCQAGDVVPLVPADVANVLNRQSTVYSKMQQYLQRPFAQYGYLGPSDFVPTHDSDFYNAYFAIAPYQVYADPQSNQFVMPEASPFASQQQALWAGLSQQAQFQKMASSVDHGWKPTSWSPADAVNFAQSWQSLGQAVSTFDHTQRYSPSTMLADDISMFSYFDIYQRAGRHCVNGQWETRAQYTTNLIQSLNMAVATHEFGHTMGLDHNFMGSIDQRNFPLGKNGQPLLYSSSIMEYNASLVEAFWETDPNTTVWGPYDMAAMAWIYGNDQSSKSVVPLQGGAAPGTGVSGQKSATAPWADPLGWNTSTNTEIPFLTCSNQHERYTPLCQEHDMGVTPSEIVANAIQQREWNYLWTNFRLYHKYFSFENYATQAVTQLQAFRRFQTAWVFDWSQAEMTDDLRLINFPVPMNDTAGDYYVQLYNKFQSDISVANQLALGYQRAILDQSSGERPYITVYDPFYGDRVSRSTRSSSRRASRVCGPPSATSIRASRRVPTSRRSGKSATLRSRACPTRR